MVSASCMESSPLKQGIREGENPVVDQLYTKPRTTHALRVELFGIAALSGW